jgi:hypothetical protein
MNLPEFPKRREISREFERVSQVPCCLVVRPRGVHDFSTHTAQRVCVWSPPRLAPVTRRFPDVCHLKPPTVKIAIRCYFLGQWCRRLFATGSAEIHSSFNRADGTSIHLSVFCALWSPAQHFIFRTNDQSSPPPSPL